MVAIHKNIRSWYKYILPRRLTLKNNPIGIYRWLFWAWGNKAYKKQAQIDPIEKKIIEKKIEELTGLKINNYSKEITPEQFIKFKKSLQMTIDIRFKSLIERQKEDKSIDPIFLNKIEKNEYFKCLFFEAFIEGIDYYPVFKKFFNMGDNENEKQTKDINHE